MQVLSKVKLYILGPTLAFLIYKIWRKDKKISKKLWENAIHAVALRVKNGAGNRFFCKCFEISSFKEKCGDLQSNNSNKCCLYTMII